MRRVWGLLVIMAISAFAGCTQRRVEIGVAVSDKQKTDLDFYAYTTRLPAVAPEEVRLVLATATDVERRIDLEIPESVSVYPILMQDEVPYRYIHPDLIGQLVPDSPVSLEEDLGRPFVLGRFDHMLAYAPNWKVYEAPSAVAGVQWADLDERLMDVVREGILRMRNDAAAYGARAVVGITVTVAEGHSSSRTAAEYLGLRLHGRAVVFDQSGEGVRQPSEPRLLSPTASR